MYFRTKNFGIEDCSRERFDSVFENGVSKISCSKHGVIVGQGETVLLVRKDGRTKKITKFDSPVAALDVREDIIVCGDGSGHLKVIGGLKSVIRRYNEHEAGINDIRIHSDNVIVSCSDDMKIKIYDISKESSVITISDHTDYIKSIDIAENVLFSGSYDGFIYGYCLETFKKMFSYKFRGPVSKICCLNNGRLAFASRNEIFVIDTHDPELLITKPIHTKEITKLLYYGNRLYTSSLDASFRVLTADLRLVSRVGARCGIVDFCIFKDVLYLGLEDGEVLRLVKDEEKIQDREDNKWSDEEESAFERIWNPVKKHDALERKLNRFEYKKSMVDAVRERDVQEIFAVMTFIHEKREFEHALQDLDRTTLATILDVIIEFFNWKEIIPAFVECVEMIVFLYERDILDDRELIQRIHALRSVVDDELYFQEQNLRTISFLECFLG